MVNLAISYDFHGTKMVHHTINEFCEHYFLGKKFHGYTFIAHFGGGYDEHFILSWSTRNNIKPETLFRVTKLMYMAVGKRFRFIDILNFIPMGLDKFPSTFGFEGGKGFFPHKLNKPENYEYEGKIPDISRLGP